MLVTHLVRSLEVLAETETRLAVCCGDIDPKLVSGAAHRSAEGTVSPAAGGRCAGADDHTPIGTPLHYREAALPRVQRSLPTNTGPEHAQLRARLAEIRIRIGSLACRSVAFTSDGGSEPRRPPLQPSESNPLAVPPPPLPLLQSDLCADPLFAICGPAEIVEALKESDRSKQCAVERKLMEADGLSSPQFQRNEALTRLLDQINDTIVEINSEIKVWESAY